MILRCLIVLLLCLSATTHAQEDGRSDSLLDFAQDVKPILDAKCLECHGPDEAKNDFRVDDEETFLSYIEPGDLEDSYLWTDYLITDDPDMMMPPPDKPQLTGVELATIRLWIEEGAEWSEPAEEILADQSGANADPIIEQPLPLRIFIFQGLFHPATVHFPVALLTVSTFCLFLSFFNRDSFEPAAFHCLWIGAFGAVAACVAGWGYAIYEGYGAGYSLNLRDSTIDRHRWLGIGVAALSLILLPMARSVRKRRDGGMRFLWFIGSVCALVGVSFVGYQGGELTYGEDHYMEEYERLFPAATTASDDASESESDAKTSTEETSTEETSTEETSTEETSTEETSTEDTSESDADDSSDGDTPPDAEAEESDADSSGETSSEATDDEAT